MIVNKLVVGPLQCNCVILGCEKTREAVVLDPGDEAERIFEQIHAAGLKVKYLIHTHAHFDHVGATRGLKQRLSASSAAAPCLHKADEELYKMLPLQGKLFGMELGAAPPLEKYLEDEEILSFGEHRLQVLHTPGHSPGSVCLKLLDGEEWLFSGDTLFNQSIGRTDLWGGDYSQILRSIKQRLMVLDDDTKVQPGHGPDTLIGVEKRSNPFL
jgi:glyoxylase-like metal-dependent hydrolase (beta-lactamase superfamily II)